LKDGPALIILALITANIRNSVLPSSKVHALDAFLALSCHLTDEAKLDRMVPYIVELLNDDAALVRSAALRTLMQVVCCFPYVLYSHLANLHVAHDRDCNHPFQRSHLPRVYHPQHQASGSRPRSLCTVYLRAVYCTARGHGSAIPRDGSSTESTWGVQSVGRSSGI